MALTKGTQPLSAADQASMRDQIAVPSTTRFTLLDILTRSRRARLDNLRTRGLMASGDKPTVTQSTTEPNTSTYNRRPNNPTSVADYDQWVAVLGGWKVFASNRIGAYSVTKELSQPTGQGAGISYQGAYRIQFYMDGDWVTFGINCTNTQNWRLIIDGKYYDMAGFTPSSTGLVYWTLDFSGLSTPRKIRKVEVELQMSSSSNPQTFGRVYVQRTATIWPPSREEIGPRVIILGDSTTLGKNATFYADGWARVLGDYMGIDDLWIGGFSGGGYLVGGNSDGGPNALERITDVTAWSPDLVIVANGSNEQGLDGTTVRAGLINSTNTRVQAQAVFSAIRTALPTVPVLVLGPWRNGSAAERARNPEYDAAIATGVANMNDPLLSYATQIGLFSGSGRVGATAGDGNSDLYISSDGTHSTDAGHNYIARFMEPRAIAALTAIASAAA